MYIEYYCAKCDWTQPAKDGLAGVCPECGAGLFLRKRQEGGEDE